MTTDLCYLTATEAIGLFRARKLSPVELLSAYISRAQAVEPTINAFTDTYFDEAMAEAKAAEQRYMSGDAQTLRQMEGLPVAVKDAQRVAGKRTTYGSAILVDNVDDHSDPMIERLQGAGAIIHARTTTPEFCLSSSCNTKLWGRTLNPFNTQYGPGGSSGGSAASLAAGTSALATGTDIGGSIRIPASCCGLVGYKPPKGRNPDGPPANFDPYNHCGPLARSVADAALVQNVVSGPHPRDHSSLRDKVHVPDAFAPVRGMRIAWSMDLGYMPIDREVRKATLAALDIFRSLGCTVEEVDLGWTTECDKAALAWYNAMHFGRQPLFVSMPSLLDGAVELLPGLTYPIYRLAIILVGLLVALGLYLLINRTRIGMLVRAGSTNREMVRALGVNVGMLYTIVFGLGALLAGLAGVMAGPILAVQVGMGEQILITTFVVVVIGGVGSIRGAFVASLLLGVVDTMLRAYLPSMLRHVMIGSDADALGAGISSMGIYLLMAVVLLIRPKGLFAPNS